MNLENILLSDNVVDSINNNINCLLILIPEIKYMIGFDQKNHHHHLDLWNHTLYALSLSKKDFDIRLSLLLHDIGKPFSYQDEKIRHFYNHPLVSSNMARIILNRLYYNDKYIDYICDLIRFHDTIIKEEKIKKEYDFCLKLYEIQRCDAMAHHPDKLEKRIKYLEKTKKRLLFRGDNNGND